MENKKIALTFDDGPCKNTLKVLKILKKHKAKATFFILGKKINGNEYIIKKTLKQDCEIENHLYSHLYWLKSIFKSKQFWLDEIKKTDDKLLKLNIKTNFVRFPYVQSGIWGKSAARQLKKQIARYNIDSLDWFYRNPKTIINRVLKKVKDKDILIFHDYLENIGENNKLPKILEKIIPELKRRGYEFVKLSELKK